MLKRFFDVVVSAAGLTLLTIPFALISLAIKLDDGGPVFYRQVRAGKDGKPFHIWKFRTMVVGAEQQGLGLNVAKDDPRITRVGRFLRNFGLDELPQLINVLLGEMSLVGPRPTLPYQVQHYNEHQRKRLKMKPGITSLAVVSGRNALSWQERIELDIQYVENWSLWLDLKILLKTPWVVLVKREGLYGPEGVNDPFVEPANAESERSHAKG